MTGPKSSTSQKTLARTLILCLSAAATGVLLFEGICRVAGVDLNPNPYWRFHPVLGWTQELSRSFDVVVDGEPVRVEFNSRGFRDVEHTREKPEGTRRLVVLGDSFSEAVQVNLEQVYWHRLQELLSDRGGAPWEAINLGVGDYGNTQSLIALSEIGLQYEPDLVLLQIFPLNDICNNSIGLAGVCKSQNDAFRPYFHLSGGALAITRTEPWKHWLRSHLHSFGLAERAYRSLVEPAQLTDDLHRARYRALGIPAEPLLYTYAASEDQVEGIAHGWEMTEAILREVDEVCRSHAVRWIPVVIPFEARLATQWESFAAQFQAAPLQRDYPERRLGALFDELGVPAVLLLEAFDGEVDAVLPYLGGHLNIAAHEIVAHEVYRAVTRSGVLGSLTAEE